MDDFEDMSRDELLRAVRYLHKQINTPELVDFAKAVRLEAVHQEQRWGTPDRRGKTPYDWHWLIAHLAGRALDHHKEAERLETVARGVIVGYDPSRPETLGNDVLRASVAHHREKAVHHCITTAAALAHWHASVLGKHTTMQPGHAPAFAAAAELAA
ncbi:MAG: hypothetical protein ACSLE9_03915 [Burkholderiaceae bacterium]